MSRRTVYNLALRAAVARVLEGQHELSLAAIERALGGALALPSRPVLARAVVAAGWSRVPRPGSGAIYRAPAAIPCACAECLDLDRQHPGGGKQLALPAAGALQ